MESRLKVLIDKEQIARKVEEAALQIRADYAGKDLVVVSVMKGALCLTADLIRQIDLPLKVEVVQCLSYGAGGTERGSLTILGVDRLHLHNRDVLLVDDIFDSGRTIGALLGSIKQLNPLTLKSLVLLCKDTPRESPYRPDYVLFDIEDVFVVGYGLDYKELYRNDPAVCILENG